VPGESDSNTSSGVTRLELLRRVWPHSEQACVALHSGADGEKPRIGWVYDQDDAKRAIKAFASGQLASERFETRTKQGKPYTIEHATRLGLVLHRDDMVRVCCIDLDDHTDDGGNVHQLGPLSRFLGAQPVVFTSKGGKGLHAFFELGEPMATKDFVRWAKRWGFNRDGQPEMFPKSTGPSHVLMPGEPTPDGGDTYVSGTFASALIDHLPEPPPVDLTTKTLKFLRGEVTQPCRNDALNVAAMELGQKGVDRQTASGMCLGAADLCGLGPSEAERTFASGYDAGRSKPSSETSSRSGAGSNWAHAEDFESTGMGNAKRFVSMFGHDAKYCGVTKRWFVWNTNRWSCDQLRAEALAQLSAEEITDAKHRKSTCTKRGVEEILFLARSDTSMSVTPTDFDADPMLFNCQSGTIDLRTGKQKPHDRTQLLSRISPVRYAPMGSCPQWSMFLETAFGGDDQLIAYIRRVCGYLLTGEVSEQCLFFMHGDGCNGKSVFASVLQHILGDYARKVPAQILSRSDRVAGEGPTPFLSTLIGARLATSSELEEGQKFAEARIKDMTGGDRLTGRGLRQDPVEFDPMFKLLLYGNHKPEISGVDHGIWRRIHLIPFQVTIAASQRDPRLLDKLKGESGAILAWMVRGCKEWQQRGLRPPDAVMHATSSYRSESDTVGRFIEECCTRAAGVFVKKGDLHEAYSSWCLDSGEEPLSKGTFGARVKRLGFDEKRLNNGRLWIGLELSSSGEAGDA
jgi:putative DNA primase/helicase